MSITTRSLQKLLWANISGKKPLSVDPEQARELTEELLARVEPIARAQGRDKCSYYDLQLRHRINMLPANDLCCCILLNEPSEGRDQNYTHLHLLRTPEQNLLVELGSKRSSLVSDIGEVFALVQAFLQRVDEQKAHAAKRQKQRELKVQAILAQVHKIAKEDGFDFATRVDSVKLQLIIRLSEYDYFAIMIPFHKFKEVLLNLRTAIQALRNTYNSGVHFKTRIKNGCRIYNWTRHQDL